MNEQNLIKNEDLTPSQRRANASKAGKASGEARRRKKDIQRIAEVWMSLPILGPNRNRLMELGLKEEDLNNQWPLVMMGLQKKILQGDVKAVEKMQELANQQTSKLIELKERELALRERELKIKEELLKQDNKVGDDDKTTIIYDI